MNLLSKLGVLGVATVSILATPAFATAQATPVTAGNVVTLSSSGPRTFNFHVNVLPDGTVAGHGEINVRAVNARFHFDINQLQYESGYIIFAGPITLTSGSGAPPVGFNAFFAVANDGLSLTGIGVEPPQNDTIAEIIASRGLPPPAASNSQFLGNIQVF